MPLWTRSLAPERLRWSRPGPSPGLITGESASEIRVGASTSAARLPASSPSGLSGEDLNRALHTAGAGKTRVGGDERDVECLSERHVSGIVRREIVA